MDNLSPDYHLYKAQPINQTTHPLLSYYKHPIMGRNGRIQRKADLIIEDGRLRVPQVISKKLILILYQEHIIIIK
jgi:hypothetical protein